MTDTSHNPADYATSHWRRGETIEEHDRRVMTAELEANTLFARATVKQKAVYDAAIVRARALGFAGPKFDRAKEAAKRVWTESTTDARNLFNRTCDALMRDGEVSEELSREWDFLIDAERAAELWADDLAEQIVADQRMIVVGDHAPEAA